MAIPNPQTWSSMNLMDQGQMQNFLQQLALWATQTQSPASLINSNPGSVQGGALQSVSQYLNGVSGTQRVNCANAASVMVEINFTANSNLILNSLPVGVPVVIKATNTGAGSNTLQIFANTASNTIYSIKGKNTGLVDLTATGITLGSSASAVFAGNSDNAGATPSLWLVYN